MAVVVAAHRGAQEEPVETGAPRVVGEPLHLETGALLGVEPPANAGRADPVGDPGEVVVIEVEAPAADVGADQVEHVARRHPAAGDLDQPGGHGEQRVGAGQGAVGEPDPEPMGGVTFVHHPLEPEARRDQRRVGLDVRTHHEDVARLEGRVVVEQPDEHLTQHVDLARGAVAGMYLQAAVVGRRHPRGPELAVGSPVGAEVGLEPAEERGPLLQRGSRGRLDADVVEDPAQLAGVTAQGCQQRVVDSLGGRVVVARDHPADAPQVVPEHRRGLGKPQVDVTSLAERAEQLHLGDRQPGVAEEGEPVRQVETVECRSVAVAQHRHRLAVAHVGRRLPDVGEQPAPQLRLPEQVGVEGRAGAVGVATGAPVGDEGRSLHGVRREDAGQPARDRPAASAAEVTFVAGDTVAEVAGKGGRPRLVERGVEDLEQRPHQPVGIPGVVALAVEQQRDEGPRAEEAHPGTDAVTAGRAGAEPMGEPLGQPALHTAGGHGHDLGGERIGQRGGEQVAELVGQEVGARRTVKLQDQPATSFSPACTPGRATATDPT